MKIKRIFTLLAILLLCCIIYDKSEAFAPYVTLPDSMYSKWRTGSQPFSYYNLPIYHKPYRYGIKYYTSSPYPNHASLPT